MSYLSPLAAPDPNDRLSAEGLVDVLRAAGESTRLRILVLLERGDLTVKDLTEILGQSQPRISRHLKLLVEAGLIDRFPEGSWVYYRLASSVAAVTLATVLGSLLDARDPGLIRDRERLDAVKRAHAERAAAYFSRNASKWDVIRSLQVEEAAVEAAILDMLGTAPFDALLDIGTGTGRIIELLDGRFARAVGIDQSHDMLAIARTHLDRAKISGVQVRHGDVYSLNLPRDSYDVVTIHQVLHYLDDPARAIREAVRVLRPGGRLLIVDLSPHNEESLRDEHAHRRLGFNHAEITRALNAAGLETVTVQDIPASSSDPDKLGVTIWIGTHLKPQPVRTHKTQEIPA
jgi:ubiquinone/menaquinone biosynthesis C-methylase UbiE/DNA-binding transcriptional ArsR family regulator